MTATHYNGSRGPVEINSMLYPHLKNARDKLVRDQRNGERQAEIEAMSARLAHLDTERAEEEAKANG